MNCDMSRDLLGPYLDGELPEGQVAELEEHVRSCPACAGELAEQRALCSRLNSQGERYVIKAPPQLWSAIERRLDAPEPRRIGRRVIYFFRRPLAAAASLAILIGAAAFVGFWLSSVVQKAQADVIDYTVLLDGLAEDMDASVQRFLTYYGAEPIEAHSVHAAAPQLSFAIPPDLPGGYRLERVYRLQFGDSAGIAARYRRGQEPLVVFFHPPVDKKNLGVHRESPCIVGKHYGHEVKVGPWRLIHFTDPTTCHCLLSKLSTDAEIFAVMERIAPEFSKGVHTPH